MKTSIKELLNQLNRKYMNNASKVAAVTQTLAGERLTQTVTFPTTGDNDCDLIQGVLAVINSMGDTYGDRVALVLRYLADRFTANERAHAETTTRNYELQNLVHRQQALEQHMIQLENRVTGQLGVYHSLGGMGGPMGGPINPYTTPNPYTTAGQQASLDALASLCPPQMQVSQASDKLDKLYNQIRNSP